MRIAAGIEYCGTKFNGWQRQKHAPSIQKHVEKALSKVADHPIRIHCAGRTDTGVHALHQVIHFETQTHRENYSWVLGGNANMCDDISMLWAKEVPDNFHARFLATSRTYRYVILNRPTRPAIYSNLVTWERRELDLEKMSLAASALVGEHDFTSYRATSCQAKSPVRVVRRLDIRRVDSYVVLEVEANAFLQHMVRNIVGVLMAIARGEREPQWAKQILLSRNRTMGGVTAPPKGLYLINIEYPEKFNIQKPEVSNMVLVC